LLPLLNLGSIQAPPDPKYKVKTAHFVGFNSSGSEQVKILIEQELVNHDTTIVDSVAEAEVLILSEDRLSDESLPDRIQDLRGDVRVIVVTGNLVARSLDLLPCDNHVLSNRPIRFLKPPFAPSMLKSMNEFLEEETPFRLLPLRARRQGASSSSQQSEQERGRTSALGVERDASSSSSSKTQTKEQEAASTEPSADALQSAGDDTEFKVLIVEVSTMILS